MNKRCRGAADLGEVQRLLNLRTASLGMGPIRTDGVLDAETGRALAGYAVRVLGTAAPKGGLLGERLIAALADVSPSTLMREAARAREAGRRMSGAGWLRRNAAAIADSRELGDLSPVFGVRVTRFVRQLERASGTGRHDPRSPAPIGLCRRARRIMTGMLLPWR